MTSEEHVVELLPAYALGSLEDEEILRVVDHLQGCNSCTTELETYQQVVDILPLAVEKHDPPAELKQVILRSVEGSGAGRVQPRPSFWSQLTGIFRGPTSVWAWTGLALVLVLAFSNLLLWQRMRALQAPSPSALQVVVLTGAEAAPGATGSMVIGRDGVVGTLVVDGLPPLDDMHQYQLWFIQDGERISGGVFSVSEDGYGSLYIHAPQPVESFTALGVTIEPAGGSPGPTGERVLGGDL